MEKAIAEVKERADIVISSNDENDISWFVRKIVLLAEKYRIYEKFVVKKVFVKKTNIWYTYIETCF